MLCIVIPDALSPVCSVGDAEMPESMDRAMALDIEIREQAEAVDEGLEEEELQQDDDEEDEDDVQPQAVSSPIRCCGLISFYTPCRVCCCVCCCPCVRLATTVRRTSCLR